jgi:hypothetical protein
LFLNWFEREKFDNEYTPSNSWRRHWHKLVGIELDNRRELVRVDLDGRELVGVGHTTRAETLELVGVAASRPADARELLTTWPDARPRGKE